MNALQRRLLARLEQLSPTATICPGQLARACGSTLPAARDDLLALAEDGRVRLSQRGRRVPPGAIKGPFRVRLERP